VPAPYRGILFDLFGTLVLFDPSRLPAFEIPGTSGRNTLGALLELLAEFVPGTTAGEFFQALVSVSDEMARARAYDHVELPSRERFRRALERVGCDEERLLEAAVHCSRAHMASIVAATVLPPAHAELIARLRGRFKLALVSNFDDTAAAYDLLRHHDLADAFDTIVVSEALGLRKPHPALLRTALRGLDVPAHAALFVGDTFRDDVGGAQAANVDVAWIDPEGRGVPDGVTPPTYTIPQLTDIARIVGA
jgi:putative hydrolase of the HAD superfamily